jgi:hypothetical protein
VNTQVITEKQSQETCELSRGSAKYNTCLLPRCGVPMDEDCTQPLSSDPMINLNTTVFLFLISFPVHDESPQVGVSRPYNKDYGESTRVRMGSNTHKSAAIHTHKPRLELKMTHNEFTTRTELKSLTRSIKCAETECGRLRMLKVCLGYSSMRLGVPFIAPRQLGAVGG